MEEKPIIVKFESQQVISQRMVSAHDDITVYECVGVTAEGQRWSFKIEQHRRSEMSDNGVTFLRTVNERDYGYVHSIAEAPADD